MSNHPVFPLILFPDSTLKYADYINLYEFTAKPECDCITGALTEAAPNICRDFQIAINESAKKIVAGQALSTHLITESHSRDSQLTREVIENGMSDIGNALYEISDEIYRLESTVSYGLDKVHNGIESFHSDFNIAMGEVLAVFELLRNEVKIGMEQIIAILKNPTRVKAEEHFRNGIDCYVKGCRFPKKDFWMNDALEELNKSVGIYKWNSIAHFLLGHIYHSNKKNQNLEKAIEHFELCFDYSEPEKEQHELSAQGYFYAGWLYAVVRRDYLKAIELTQKALEFNPEISMGYYHLAKFFAMIKDEKSSLNFLQRAITFDKNYLSLAAEDVDFRLVAGSGRELKEKLLLILFNMPEKDLRKFNFEGINLVGANLNGSNLSGMDLRELNFFGADLGNCDLSEADITGAKFNDAKLNGAKLVKTTIEKADFSESDLRKAEIDNCKKPIKVKFNQANLSEAKISEIDFQECEFAGADFNKAILFKIDFDNNIIFNARFDITKMDFETLKSAFKKDLNLSGAVFFDPDSESLDLSNIDISDPIIYDLLRRSVDWDPVFRMQYLSRFS